jgi:DNA-binding NarL/FixJ family response regulator
METSMSITVLLVDDNALFREGIGEILRTDGRFQVLGEASRGEEAVAAARQLRPDLILMDLRMPGMSGADAIRRIRAENATVPIAVLTMLETTDSVQAALDAGASGYLAKDSTPADLCDAAAALASGQPAFQPMAPTERRAASSPSPGLLASLTAREVEVLRALATGANTETIAQNMGISPRTLRNHISHTYHKLRIYDRAQAVIVAIQAGLVDVHRP